MISMICKKGYTLQIIYDGDGKYYKGMVDQKTGHVYCRLTCAVTSKELAEKLPINRQFYTKDNVDCNGGAGCFPALH